MSWESWYKNEKQNLADYFTFLRFQSIATNPAFRPQVDACAQWLSGKLQDAGLKVELWESDKGPPVIYATDLRAGPEKETVLLYCHYDVQPVDPENLWDSPPFEPVLKGDQVFARGASDNKGQCFYTYLALKSVLENNKSFPVNVKFIIEGQEECGSTALHYLLPKKKKELKADHLLIVDSGFYTMDKPTLSLGARGLISLTLILEEAAFDLHSGVAGGIAYNPNRALTALLSKVFDANGKVAIPGFYDGIVPLEPEMKKQLNFDFDRKKFAKTFGFEPKVKEPNVANWLEPTFEINGISGGYAGPGFKTVIPAKAMAKISCRLVPGQDPARILKLVTKFLQDNAPKEVKVIVEPEKEPSPGFRTSPDSRIVKMMTCAYEKVFKKPIDKILLGASIPVSYDLMNVAEAEIVLVGLGLADDHIHAPNERFDLNRLFLGYLTICSTFDCFAESK